MRRPASWSANGGTTSSPTRPTTCVSRGRRFFGPVLTVLRCRDEDDAIRIANDGDYGLAGSVWAADTVHGLRIAAGVRTGNYGINMYMLDIGTPFGGFKQSGLGREFGPEGLEEYVELQSVVCSGKMPPLPG